MSGVLQPARNVAFALLAVWSLLPLVLLGVVTFSGGWRFPSFVGADPGTLPWAVLEGSGRRLAVATSTSIVLAALTGVLAAAGGMVAGRALTTLRGVPRGLGASAAFLPLAVPPLALGVGLQFTLLRLGLGGSTTGVLLAHTVPALGYTTLYFLGVLPSYDTELEEEARRLGARRRQVLTRVTLPLLARPLAEAAVLGFLVSWAQVPLTLLVGQGRVRTLTVEVLSWMQAGQDPLAAAGSLALAIPPLLLIMAIGLTVERTDTVLP